MTRRTLSDAITNISPEFIEKAANHTAKPKTVKRAWIKYCAMAACLALILAIPMTVKFAQNAQSPQSTIADGLSRPYRDISVDLPNLAVAWKWEYLTDFERYSSIDIDGTDFIRLGEELSPSVIGGKIGEHMAVGYNHPYETPEGGYRKTFEAYAIENISPDLMLALKMEDGYYCFISSAARTQLRNMSMGDMLQLYGLSDSARLEAFCKHTPNQGYEYFSLENDSYIWEVLSACTDASTVKATEWKWDGEYYGFRISSDTFGFFRKFVYISENGYVYTDIFETECIYDIGEEAAGKIIAHALKNSDKAAQMYYEKIVVGTVVEITDEYILLDDSALCKDPEFGASFKIMLNNPRISRYVTDGRLKTGDLVSVVYKNAVDASDGYTVDSAISAEPVFISEDAFGEAPAPGAVFTDVSNGAPADPPASTSAN